MLPSRPRWKRLLPFTTSTSSLKVPSRPRVVEPRRRKRPRLEWPIAKRCSLLPRAERQFPLFDFPCSTFFLSSFFGSSLDSYIRGHAFFLFFGQEGGRQETFLFILFIRALFEAPISERLAFCTDRLLCYLFLPTKGKEALKVGQGPRGDYGSNGHRSCCLPAR